MKQELTVRGIARAKRGCHAAGMDDTGKLVLRQRWSRHARRPCRAPRPPGRLGLEACGGAPDGARRFREPGPEVQRRAPPCVKPDVQSKTNDRRDAEAIAAAVPRPTRRCVPTKAVDQHERPALHRGRERLRGERPALGHAGHGLLHEEGSVLPKGVAQCRHAVVGTLEAEQDTRPPLSQEMVWQLGDELAGLAKPRASDQEQRAALATTPPAGQRLRTMPGLGP